MYSSNIWADLMQQGIRFQLTLELKRFYYFLATARILK